MWPHHVERGAAGNSGCHLGRERVADDAPGDARFGRHLLLQVEVEHLVVRHGGQTAIARHDIAAGRACLHCLHQPEAIVTPPCRAVRMDVDDGHRLPIRYRSLLDIL
jgi:hypothetical protein